jgi:hypothetical protein
VSVALIDDQHLSSVLRGNRARPLRSAALYTTGYWYVRLCQAVLGAAARPGVLSGPFVDLPGDLSERATAAVLGLPDVIGLISLRELGPVIGQLRRGHNLNVLGMEALAAATQLEATVFLSAPSPLLEAALVQEGRRVKVGT